MSTPSPSGDAGRMSVMLTTADMKASLAFYRDVLGFKLDESWPDPDAPQWASLSLNGQAIMFGAKCSPEAAASCPGNPEATEAYKAMAADLVESRPGAGVLIYIQLPDPDALAERIERKGKKLDTHPRDQFYGIRDFQVRDPDGYRLVFFKPITMSSCQSCGMPLTDAVPGQMYCSYCTDEHGKLRSYEQILEGTITGYFMGMQKMSRPDAEKAAREHLSKMPAWMTRA